MSNTTPPNWTDDILGMFNVIDRVTSWLRLAAAPASPTTRRTDMVEMSMPFNPDVTLNELIAHLGKYGIVAVRSGFNSQQMTYLIRRSQLRWHDARLRITQTADGPRVQLLGGPSWAEKAAAQPRRPNGRYAHKSRRRSKHP